MLSSTDRPNKKLLHAALREANSGIGSSDKCRLGPDKARLDYRVLSTGLIRALRSMKSCYDKSPWKREPVSNDAQRLDVTETSEKGCGGLKRFLLLAREELIFFVPQERKRRDETFLY